MLYPKEGLLRPSLKMIFIGPKCDLPLRQVRYPSLTNLSLSQDFFLTLGLPVQVWQGPALHTTIRETSQNPSLIYLTRY